MSYAGVESDREYEDRRRRELDRIVPYGEDPKAYALRSARSQLEFHRAKVKELTAYVKRLEREARGSS